MSADELWEASRYREPQYPRKRGRYSWEGGGIEYYDPETDRTLWVERDPAMAEPHPTISYESRSGGMRAELEFGDGRTIYSYSDPPEDRPTEIYFLPAIEEPTTWNVVTLRDSAHAPVLQISPAGAWLVECNCSRCRRTGPGPLATDGHAYRRRTRARRRRR